MDGGDAEVEAALPRNLIRRAVTPLVALHGQDALHEQLAALMDKVRAVPLHKLSPSTPKPKRGCLPRFQPEFWPKVICNSLARPMSARSARHRRTWSRQIH